MTIYSDYSRDRIGWFLGLSGWQLLTLATTVLPFFWAVKEQSWALAGLLLVAWVAVLAVTVIPVRGRPAFGWLIAATRFAWGGSRGWTSFRSAASRGQAAPLDAADLPGVLQCLQIHDGPPQGPAARRVAIIQDHGARTWAVTAALVHPGIGMTEPAERHRQGTALSELLDLACRTELIDEVLFLVRTVPEDGAERAVWRDRHRHPAAPPLAAQVNDQLATGLTGASVRTETFCTLVVPERRLAREARECGGGLEGRARVMVGLMAEIEAHLRGGLSMTSVTWLTSPELAVACRTGFAPSDRAAVVDALAARDHHPGVNAEVPWAMAGPSGADTVVRHYSHDAWNSISATLKLPDKGAVMGALAPVLTPGASGERRSLLIAYPVLATTAADRQSARSEWAAEIGTHLRTRAGITQRARQRDEAAKAHGMDAKLARGNAMIRPYAVVTVTVPKTLRIAEYGRRLDAAVRHAGYAPLRLDLAQDVGFAASVVPLGISLTRKGDA